ncbi:hypothetical protein ACTAZI_06300 [Legionella bozemanae]|uniref:hypothetical protein n=1 Tax=Legionella bozemanae TaxID=447 RepID=UPI00399C7366
MKRKYSVLNRRNNTQDEKIVTVTKKLRLFDFNEHSDRKSALIKSEGSGKLKRVCTMDKSGYQSDEEWPEYIQQIIANHQQNPAWRINLFDRYSVSPELKIDSQLVLRNAMPHLKQEGMGIFIFKDCNGSISLQESSLEYCTRLIITNTEQHLVLDSHLQIAVAEIHGFINEDFRYVTKYLKECNVDLHSPSTQITVIYGPYPDYINEEEEEEQNDIELPGFLIAFMLEETLKRPIVSIKACPEKISQIDLTTGAISRVALDKQLDSDADDEYNIDEETRSFVI